MSRLTTFDKVRNCYVIKPDADQGMNIQKLGQLEDRDDPKELTMDKGRSYCRSCGEFIDPCNLEANFCKNCGQRLKWPWI